MRLQSVSTDPAPHPAIDTSQVQDTSAYSMLLDNGNSTCVPLFLSSNSMEVAVEVALPAQIIQYRLVTSGIHECSVATVQTFTSDTCSGGIYRECIITEDTPPDIYSRVCLVRCHCLVGPCDFLHVRFNLVPWYPTLSAADVCEIDFVDPIINLTNRTYVW